MSKDNRDALAEFMQHRDCIEQLLGALDSITDDHYQWKPEDINWGHVGTVASIKHDLENILEKLNIDVDQLYAAE